MIQLRRYRIFAKKDYSAFSPTLRHEIKRVELDLNNIVTSSSKRMSSRKHIEKEFMKLVIRVLLLAMRHEEITKNMLASLPHAVILGDIGISREAEKLILSIADISLPNTNRNQFLQDQTNRIKSYISTS